MCKHREGEFVVTATLAANEREELRGYGVSTDVDPAARKRLERLL